MPQQVLIVDDNAGNRKLLFFALNSSDYVLHEAETGAEAIAIINTTAIDLALLDVELPDVNGLDLAEIVRRRFPKALLIILSVLDTNETFKHAFQAGANAYVIKPYNLRNVLKMIRQLQQQPVTPRTQMLILQNNTQVLGQYHPSDQAENESLTEGASRK